MKLIAIKPIYIDGAVATEGTEIETGEQHGRELLIKGYAKLPDELQPAEPEPEPEPEASAGGKKSKAK